MGTKESEYWKLGLSKHREVNRIGSEYQITLPKNEVSIIYNFFRNRPVDRFNSKDNYHRMMIGSWEAVHNKEFLRPMGQIAFIAPSLLFGIYYFVVFF